MALNTESGDPRCSRPLKKRRPNDANLPFPKTAGRIAKIMSATIVMLTREINSAEIICDLTH
jgi:hypothetical protein